MTQAPSPLSDQSLQQLAAEVSTPEAAEPKKAERRRRPGSATLQPIRSRASRTIKARIERGIAWYVDPKAEQAANEAAERVHDEISRRLQRELDGLSAATINLELLKGELRELQGVLEEIGQAIAPVTGLGGARTRMKELREKVNDIDRRTRRLSQRKSAAGDDVPAAVSVAEASQTASSARFDYVGFERRFRGDSEAVTATQVERYLELVRAHAPVLDIGCGRGEFVGALAAAGIAATGVDLDDAAVAEAVELGRDVRRQDALSALREAEPGAFGAAVAFHVVEHLELDPLLELLELLAERLRPGGVFVAETPNPASLIVLGNSYVLDPTHVRPLHPSLLVFLCERAGFRDIELRFFAPAEGYRLPLVETEDAPHWLEQVNTAFTRLNDVLFGPQEYAVIARTPGG